MFKQIARDSITAAETKKRIIAYAYCQAEPTLSSNKYWHGNISTYILNLRLSGIYGENPIEQDLSGKTDSQLSLAKYSYLASTIFVQETSNLNQDEFVRCLYQAFLGRSADPGGFANKLQQLQNGISRLNLVKGIRNSEEAQNFFLNITDCLNDRYFLDLVRRIYLNSDYSDASVFANLLPYQRGITRTQILQDVQQFQQLQAALKEREHDFGCQDSSFLKDSEQLTNEDFIRQLYLTYLKREADINGLQSQIAQLESGAERRQVLHNLRTSDEAVNTFVHLTSNLNNITFIELAYRIYHKTQLSPIQKQKNLEKLESGLVRQTILSPEEFAQSNQEQKGNSVSANNSFELDGARSIDPSDRQIFFQQWQVKDSEFIQRTNNLNNSEFIHQLYQFFLQRNVDQAELQEHQQQFERETSRLELFEQVRRSKKAAKLFIQITQDLDHAQFLDTAYAIYFHKKLDPEDKLVYLQFLNRGNPRSDILN